MIEFDTDINDIDEAIEYIYNMLDNKHKNDMFDAIMLTNDILANPAAYVGPEAANAATKLAAQRVRLGLFGAYLKSIPTAGNKFDRTKKDAVLTICDYILELINCLKLRSKVDGQ